MSNEAKNTIGYSSKVNRIHSAVIISRHFFFYYICLSFILVLNKYRKDDRSGKYKKGNPYCKNDDFR